MGGIGSVTGHQAWGSDILSGPSRLGDFFTEYEGLQPNCAGEDTLICKYFARKSKKRDYDTMHDIYKSYFERFGRPPFKAESVVVHVRLGDVITGPNAWTDGRHVNSGNNWQYPYVMGSKCWEAVLNELVPSKGPVILVYSVDHHSSDEQKEWSRKYLASLVRLIQDFNHSVCLRSSSTDSDALFLASSPFLVVTGNKYGKLARTMAEMLGGRVFDPLNTWCRNMNFGYSNVGEAGDAEYTKTCSTDSCSLQQG